MTITAWITTLTTESRWPDVSCATAHAYYSMSEAETSAATTPVAGDDLRTLSEAAVAKRPELHRYCARMLDMPVTAVKAALHRGRTRLTELATRPPDQKSSLMRSPEHQQFVRLFNERDWQGLSPPC